MFHFPISLVAAHDKIINEAPNWILKQRDVALWIILCLWEATLELTEQESEPDVFWEPGWSGGCVFPNIGNHMEEKVGNIPLQVIYHPFDSKDFSLFLFKSWKQLFSYPAVLNLTPFPQKKCSNLCSGTQQFRGMSCEEKCSNATIVKIEW